MAKGAAEELLGQYRARGIARIEEALLQRENETDNCDFKQFESGNYRNVLGKAMSAFANTDGGIIVWGIEAKSGQASAPKPIENLSIAKQSLLDAYSAVLDPLLQGLDTIAIATREQPDTGFLVSYIPQSTGKPHRSAAKHDHRYYIRIGGNSELLPHRLLADLVVARSRPELSVTFSSWWLRPGMELGLRFKISNVGDKAAHGSALAVSGNAKINVRQHARPVEFMIAGSLVQASLYELSGAGTIYPGTTVPAGEVSFEFVGGKHASSLLGFVATCRIYALDFTAEQVVRGSELDVPQP